MRGVVCVKHRNATGYYDDYNVFIEKINDNELIKRYLICAIMRNANYFLEELVLVNNNFEVQSLRYCDFITKLGEKRDLYISKKYKLVIPSKEDVSMFLKKVYEVKYMGIYESFETYISQMFKVIYWFKPNYLGGNNEKYLNISDQNDDVILYKREIFLEKNIATMMMRENIVSSINRLMGFIGKSVDDVLNMDEKKQLTYIALTRNLIAHNSGITTNIYLKKLNDNGIINNLSKGEYIFQGEDDKSICTNEISDFIQKLIERIDCLILEYFN